MKIKSIETFSSEFAGFVRVTTNSGETGWGVEINQNWLENSIYQISEVDG